MQIGRARKKLIRKMCAYKSAPTKVRQSGNNNASFMACNKSLSVYPNAPPAQGTKDAVAFATHFRCNKGVAISKIPAAVFAFSFTIMFQKFAFGV